MVNIFFYCATVVIWGSTWIAIKLQLGTVDPMLSVGYRFSLAAVLLLIWCMLRRIPMRFSAIEHGYMLLQGTLLFSLNYLLFYLAELQITSGLAAVIFSTIQLMNMVNGAIFLHAPLDRKVFAGGIFGLIGIYLVFRPEIASFSLQQHGVIGIGLCLLATYFASLGNILSARNQKNGLPILQTNAFGMGYGALLMLAAAWLSGKPFIFETTPAYTLSLLYLAVFGSIVAFGCYLSLIGNIGADRAAYATLLFPLVALAISTIWEGYRWSGTAVTGMLLILGGNFLLLQKKRNIPLLDIARPIRYR
ncbi:EamA family transporter [Desulfoprunum benzoelyticum]|uniref:Drug/metabolite transporter (DMT)-like permease n=1 Tax=Desulfoprunum benzoelyticum TaxID=1506996 RepID=A0A840V2P5_9BACT|nr:EamA family transporter [Desulfoprunum benzoelyticum]MBB5348140.1 drug/metabolite transporter (DMT)-like permease [Desulfoprunum benzoelyticum]MBM9530250.1 EamA family transporter [Desulfoprunum benzoelyticum]